MKLGARIKFWRIKQLSNNIDRINCQMVTLKNWKKKDKKKLKESIMALTPEEVLLYGQYRGIL